MNDLAQHEERPPLTLGGCATLACLWEATAPKPGNIYRGADFGDMSYVDLLTSGAVVGPILDQAATLGLGQTLLQAVTATQQAIGVNSNLGTLLLLAPLAVAANEGVPAWASATQQVIAAATLEETAMVYEAIRLASPGGLGEVPQADVANAPTCSLLVAMELAATRDLVARQYVNGFAEVGWGADEITRLLSEGESLAEAIVAVQVQLLALHGDSLVERKLGREASQAVATRAASVWQTRQVGREMYHAALADFDFWLRADGHRRNPGTTADLLAAALFVLLVEDRLSWPVRFYAEPHDH